MKDRIKKAFEDVRADEALLTNTTAYINNARAERERKRQKIQPLRLVGALAAVLILVASAFGLRAFYAKPVSYVSIDVNPSVELLLNRADKVISATPFNKEGETVLQKIDVAGKSYEEAIALLFSEMKSQGYFSVDSLVMMTVQTGDDSKEQILCDILLQSVSEQVEGTQPGIEIEVFPVTQQVREAAHECRISAAKYLAIQELMAVDETATIDEYSDATIGQIRQRTQTCREGHQNGEGSSVDEKHGNDQNQQSGNQNHNGKGQDNRQNHDDDREHGGGHNRG